MFHEKQDKIDPGGINEMDCFDFWGFIEWLFLGQEQKCGGDIDPEWMHH